MKFFDAHNHLQDERLAPHLAQILEERTGANPERAVVNGTCENDWPAVASLAASHSWIVPSFGLHPWFVEKSSADWREKLVAQLDAHRRSGVGEIGLDHWIEPRDFPRQIEAFTWQLVLAAERNLPASPSLPASLGTALGLDPQASGTVARFPFALIWGPGRDGARLRRTRRLFSFSPAFLQEKKAARRAIFGVIPWDRLLVETDAPDMRPPPENNRHPLADAEGRPINHPANLACAYAGLAETRGVAIETLASQVEENFSRLFG